MIKNFNIIVAMDPKRGIGKNGTMPWHLTEDLKYFKKITCGEYGHGEQNIVIMGRKTWDSIPDKFRPFQNRINIILSRNKSLLLPEGVLTADSFDSVYNLIDNLSLSTHIGNIFIIGGQQVFEQAIMLPQCEKLFITHVENNFDCDKFFPSFKSNFREISSSNLQKKDNISYYFAEYIRN